MLICKAKTTNENLAGQYEYEADNGINEKQSKIITVNVNGECNVCQLILSILRLKFSNKFMDLWNVHLTIRSENHFAH